MDKTPGLYVIAGPNGAGKSTFGNSFLPANTFLFNGDEVYATLIAQHPDIDPVRLRGGVPVALEKARDQAIAAKESFGFETNFSSDLTIELMQHFKNHGYNLHLIYFGLNDPIIAESRVQTRVNLGGHDIPTDVIEFNFHEGIKRVNSNLNQFDSISFISSELKNQVIAHCDNDMSALKIYNNLTWFNRDFKQTVLKMIDKGTQVKRRRKRGRGI